MKLKMICACALTFLCFQAGASSLTTARSLWKAQQYRRVLPALLQLRKEPKNANFELDYMIATSLSRIRGQRSRGISYLRWMQRAYADQDARLLKLVRNELRLATRNRRSPRPQVVQTRGRSTVVVAGSWGHPATVVPRGDPFDPAYIEEQARASSWREFKNTHKLARLASILSWDQTESIQVAAARLRDACGSAYDVFEFGRLVVAAPKLDHLRETDAKALASLLNKPKWGKPLQDKSIVSLILADRAVVADLARAMVKEIEGNPIGDVDIIDFGRRLSCLTLPGRSQQVDQPYEVLSLPRPQLEAGLREAAVDITLLATLGEARDYPFWLIEAVRGSHRDPYRIFSALTTVKDRFEQMSRERAINETSRAMAVRGDAAIGVALAEFLREKGVAHRVLSRFSQVPHLLRIERAEYLLLTCIAKELKIARGQVPTVFIRWLRGGH